MIITDPKMRDKMEKALKISGNIYTLEDIDRMLKSGEMQGHVHGNTWAITQVHDWPRHRSVNILYVVGDIEDTVVLETEIAEWAKDQGATVLTAIGREGWWERRTPGWGKMGTLYSKDI